VRAARLAYGLTVQQFAQLLRVSLGSAYRWEALGASVVKMGGLEEAVIRVMERFWAASRPPGVETRGRADGTLAPHFVSLAVKPATLQHALALERNDGDGDGLRALHEILNAAHGSTA
jgi:hypothetical protein